MLHSKNGARFPPDMTLGIQSPLGAFWQTPSRLSCAFYWGVDSVWPLYHKGLTGGVLQRWLSFWKGLPSPQRNSGALSEWTSKSHGDSKLLLFKNDGGHCVLGELQCCINVLLPFPLDLCLDTILSRSSMDNWFDLMAWFLHWHALSTMGPYIDMCLPFQIMSNQFNIPPGDSKLLKHLKDDLWKQDAHELNFEYRGKGSKYLRK